MMDKDTIKETGNALSKMSNNERGFFLLAIAITSACMIIVVMLYLNAVDGLVDKFNATINEQQKEFLTALKDISK